MALSRPGVDRILILDLDVHQGDGTAEIFDGDERVFTLSLHGKNNFRFRKKKSDMDIAFEDGTSDEEYLFVLFASLGGNDWEKLRFNFFFSS